MELLGVTHCVFFNHFCHLCITIETAHFLESQSIYNLDVLHLLGIYRWLWRKLNLGAAQPLECLSGGSPLVPACCILGQVGSKYKCEEW